MNEADARLLANLHTGRPLRLSTLAGSMGWKPEEVAARMDRLTASGAVLRSTGDMYTRSSDFDLSGSVYALEVKVKDWARAVHQGRGYRTWADNYCIVLGGVGPTALTKALAQVEQDQAGLYFEGRWLQRPRRRRPDASRRLLGFEYVLAAVS